MEVVKVGQNTYNLKHVAHIEDNPANQTTKKVVFASGYLVYLSHADADTLAQHLLEASERHRATDKLLKAASQAQIDALADQKKASQASMEFLKNFGDPTEGVSDAEEPISPEEYELMKEMLSNADGQALQALMDKAGNLIPSENAKETTTENVENTETVGVKTEKKTKKTDK